MRRDLRIIVLAGALVFSSATLLEAGEEKDIAVASQKVAVAADRVAKSPVARKAEKSKELAKVESVGGEAIAKETGVKVDRNVAAKAVQSKEAAHVKKQTEADVKKEAKNAQKEAESAKKEAGVQAKKNAKAAKKKAVAVKKKTSKGLKKAIKKVKVW